jgi:mycofactocin precursor
MNPTDPEVPQDTAAQDEEIAEHIIWEDLVEEVSIDGMCGVY